MLVSGVAMLPPGASGAYVLLELGEHHARSAFVPAAGLLSRHPCRTHLSLSCTMTRSMGSAKCTPRRPTRLRAPSAVLQAHHRRGHARGASSLFLDVCAWFAQSGELSMGRVEVPLPEEGGPSMRLRLDAPLGIELHWRAYGAPMSLGRDAWEEEAEPIYHHSMAGGDGRSHFSSVCEIRSRRCSSVPRAFAGGRRPVRARR